jgi:hypothetical protein
MGEKARTAMGDWSDKLDYEQRKYYGHFYDPDREEETEEETEEMTTVEILKEMAFTATETQRRALEDAISALSENKGEWLDDVKSEIDKAQEPYITNTAYDEGVRFGLMLAYQIVDRYMAESEDT